MMIKFNKFERVAGLFVLTAFFGGILAGISIAIKQGWFEPKVQYEAKFSSADGVYPGTSVLIQGLKAGAVDEVDLIDATQIQLKISIFKKYAHFIRTDTRAQLIRPFVIGERILELTPGSAAAELLPEHSQIASAENFDIFNLLSGKNLNSQLEKVSSLVANVSHLLSEVFNRNRTEAMLRMFDKLDPFLENVGEMSEEVKKLSQTLNHKDHLAVTVKNLASVTKELSVILPSLAKHNPDMGQDVQKMMKNLIVMTDYLKTMGPTIETLGPNLPSTALRLVEALNETVVLMKALQKNYFLKDHVRTVKEEESRSNKTPKTPAERLPANVPPPAK